MNPVRIHEGRGHSWQNYLCDTVQCFYEEMDSLQLLTLYLALTLTPIFSGRKAKINLHTTPKLTVVIPICCLLPCADPGIFVRGWGGGVHVNLTKKLWQRCLFVFCFFLSSRLILQKSNGEFQRKKSIFKVPEGVQIFPGGPNFSRGEGVQLLIPYRNPNNLWFSRGGSGPPALRIRTWLRSI